MIKQRITKYIRNHINKLNRKYDVAKANKFPSQNGITLIALIITIIVLLILAGIAINLIIGDNGLILRAQNAVEKWSEATNNEERYLAELTNEINEIANEKVNTGDIEFSYSPKEWTNGNVNVRLSLKKETENSKILYCTDEDKEWKEYTNNIEIDKNQNIYAKVVTEQTSSDISTYSISNIDKLLPKQPDIEVIPNKHSMTVNIIKENGDAEATEQYGCSGIREYKYYCTDGERVWQSEWTNEKTYKFSEIYGSFDGVNCKCYVVSKDIAQNESNDINKVDSKTTISKTNYYIKNYTGNFFTAGRTDIDSASWLWELTNSTGLIYCLENINGESRVAAGMFADNPNTSKLVAYGYDIQCDEWIYHDVPYYRYEASLSETGKTYYIKSAESGIYNIKNYIYEVLDDFYKE